MAFKIRLYHNFSRDINSTELPSIGNNYGTHDDYDCELFEPSSVVAPRIMLRLPMNYAIADVNYAYISQFSRYYWVTDAVWSDGLWVLTLDVDVLSSYKAHIGASYQYVVRAASSYDGSITDTLYPPNGVTSHKWINMSNLTNPFSPNIANGSFIVGIVGQADGNNSNGRFGAVNYYQFTLAQFNDFISALMANTNDWLDYQNSDLKSSTVKMILNPMQYITSCLWFPVSAGGTNVTDDIQFGWWKITGIAHKKPPTSGGYPADNGLLGFSVTSAERHPQAGRGSYLNREPYSNYRLYMPMCGFIDIPGRIMAKSSYVGVEYKIDLVSGNAVIDAYGRVNELDSSNDLPITRTTVKMGVEVPIAQIAVDTLGTAKSGANTLIGAVTNAITGNIGGVISELVNGGIDTAVKANQPIANIMPSTGSLAPYLYPARILCEFQNIANEAQPVIGRPLCNYVAINTLSGYVQCATSHVEIPGATRGEVEQVEAFMKGGFFYA